MNVDVSTKQDVNPREIGVALAQSSAFDFKEVMMGYAIHLNKHEVDGQRKLEEHAKILTSNTLALLKLQELIKAAQYHQEAEKRGLKP